MSNAQPANTPNATEVMGRKEFDAFLFDLYGCKDKNDVKADIDVSGDDIHRVEVFNSPKGLLIAAHELHRVHVIRPAAVIGSSEFWSNTSPEDDNDSGVSGLTPEDEAALSEMAEDVLRDCYVYGPPRKLGGLSRIRQQKDRPTLRGPVYSLC